MTRNVPDGIGIHAMHPGEKHKTTNRGIHPVG
eukprot:CAMPEP_0170941660 /NCGR_PEP_ID=MMETSP0735-20130129/23613_1 /TAXON_ID=186038 /ORGANISM="Fragilariopsis kerguelensis, Strain L26-C5" /LENGTH=31 /DNA_ID= /DNA_START= /DNA_END= /DNA_ORIENTATION=